MHSELIDRTIGEIVKNASMQHAILYSLCCFPKLDHLDGCTICIVMHMQKLADTGVAYHAPSLGFCNTSGQEVFAIKMVELKIMISCFSPTARLLCWEGSVMRQLFKRKSLFRNSNISEHCEIKCRPTSGPGDCVSNGLLACHYAPECSLIFWSYCC